jgi:hypothetical protein
MDGQSGQKLKSNRLRKVVKSWVNVGCQKLLKLGQKIAPGGISGLLPANFRKYTKENQGLVDVKLQFSEQGWNKS